MRKIISLITIMSLICCLTCNGDVLAYVNPQKAVSDNFDNSSLVEQGYENLKKYEPNCRFCYAYDYDGDGRQEAYVLSGIWEEGIENGKLWFIDSDGTYNIVKEGIYCNYTIIEPELVYAGNQIFLVHNQTQAGRVISIICSCRNGKSYFPEISEQVTEFHTENGHHYAYNIRDYSGVEYFYDEATGEFVLDIKTENIDINYLTKYYWVYDCGVYTKYKFNKDGTYTKYDYNGNVYRDGLKYTLNNNILTFYSDYGTSEWMFTNKSASESLSHLDAGENVFYLPETGYEYIWNTFEEVPVDKEITVLLNGEKIEFDQPPIIKNDRTMVPIRAIFEAMGYSVSWDPELQYAEATKGNNFIQVQIGNNIINYYNINGNYGGYKCDVAPQIISDRTLVPVRAISESAGCDVEWDDSTKTVHIDYQGEEYVQVEAVFDKATDTAYETVKLYFSECSEIIHKMHCSTDIDPVRFIKDNKEVEYNALKKGDVLTIVAEADAGIEFLDDNDIVTVYVNK